MSSTPRPDPQQSTRDRILSVALELFGKQGFKATTVAQIESAAGLSPGAGGLYRHFASKREVLEEGLRQQAAAGEQLLAFIENPALVRTGDLRQRLRAVARAGLRRLEQERDVNRLLLRDLADFPDLLEAFRCQELDRVYRVLAAWLRSEAAAPAAAHVDLEALAAVLVSAVSHYWVLTDVFGTHPLGVDEDRYLGVLADVAARALTGADQNAAR